MEEARRKLRVCLICVVAAAVIMGLIYYLMDAGTQEQISEGTLVRAWEQPLEQESGSAKFQAQEQFRGQRSGSAKFQALSGE